MRLVILFCLVLSMTWGCTPHTTTPAASSATADPAHGLTRHHSTFGYERSPIPFHNDVLDDEESRNYVVRHIHFPSIGDNRQRHDQVTGKYYESKHAGKKPLVIVLPIFGGHIYPSQNMTLYLKRISDGGVHVFRMLGERNLTDWWGLKQAADPEEFMRLWSITAQAEHNTIIDIRRTIDWAVARPEVDADRIAVIGFSRGAITAAVTAANDDRLAAAVLVMGGAHPHRALASCPMLRGEGVQKKVQRQFGWTLEEFADRLEPLYRDLDPASYSGLADPTRILIVEATKDKCIRADAREALWLAMGQPRRIQIPYGHKMAFLSMTPVGAKWLQKEIWSFLQETL